MKQLDNTVRVQLLNCCIADLGEEISDRLFLGISQDCQQTTLQLMIAFRDALACYKPNNGETLATGTVTLTGGSSGTIVVKVNSLVINVAVTYATSLSNTASLLATAINNYLSNPNYTATANGAVVTISAAEESGDAPNDFVVSTTLTGTLTATTTNMTGGVDADTDLNCLTQDEVDSMWDYVSKKCNLCFAPYDTVYT